MIAPGGAALSGEVLSVRFPSGEKVAKGKMPVPTPHWVPPAQSPIEDGDGSMRPAALIAGSPAVAEVRIDLAGSLPGGTGLLRGELGGLSFAGPVALAAGPQLVQVTASGVGSTLERHAGDVVWSVEAAALANPLALTPSTRLEVFVLLGTPLSVFHTSGVWVEVLRPLIQTLGLGGQSNPVAILSSVVNHLHGGRGLRYDSAGRHTSGVDERGGNFHLSAFLNPQGKKLYTQVNCFDLLAAAKILSGAVGIEPDWLTIQPFGFIRQADLIGIGPCNNPFFATNGTQPVVGQTDPHRTEFGSHGVARLVVPDTIFDATVGPHAGDLDLGHYLPAVADAHNAVNRPVPSTAFAVVRTDLRIH
jgi:hypothetical protein